MEKDEKDIVDRALWKGKHPVNLGYKRVPFTTEQELIDDVKQLYPTAISLFLANVDLKDSDGSPLLHTKKLRQLRVTTTTTKDYNGITTRVEATWKEVFAFVENGFAVLKVCSCSFGETE